MIGTLILSSKSREKNFVQKYLKTFNKQHSFSKPHDFTGGTPFEAMEQFQKKELQEWSQGISLLKSTAYLQETAIMLQPPANCFVCMRQYSHKNHQGRCGSQVGCHRCMRQCEDLFLQQMSNDMRKRMLLKWYLCRCGENNDVLNISLFERDL